MFAGRPNTMPWSREDIVQPICTHSAVLVSYTSAIFGAVGWEGRYEIDDGANELPEY